MIPVFILTRTFAISALLVGAYAAPVPAPVPVPAPSLLDTVLTYASRVNLKQTAEAVYPALLVQGRQISDKRDVSAVLASTPVEDVEALVNEVSGGSHASLGT
ncbi:hypothetical protein BD413DRAFT_611824 [Trametes elegans]|nr:hypothetical protein BD413DRAFT_611824 [Trametes elegans]